MSIFAPDSTAAAVIAILEREGFTEKTPGTWMGNRPGKQGADSRSFKVVIHDDEHGAYFYHAGNEGGSLYDLALELGVQLPSELPKTETHKTYDSLDQYARAHGLDKQDLLDAGWEEIAHTSAHYGHRPSMRYETATGPRWRFTDDQKPKYDSPDGYKPCWFGLDRAISAAKENQRPVFWVNGEVSVVAAHKRGIPAFALTNGEHGIDKNPALMQELKDKWKGTICICLDSDEAGRKASSIIAEQLYRAGFVGVRVVDMKLSKGGDIADFCMLFHENVFVQLMQRSRIPADTSGYQLAVEYAAIGKVLSAGAREGKEGRLALHRMSKLTELMFTADPRHGMLWQALLAASEPTPLLVKIKLAEMGRLDEVGDKYVDELAKANPVESELALMNQVLELFEKHALIVAINDLKILTVSNDLSAAQIVEQAVSALRQAVPTHNKLFMSTNDAADLAASAIDPDVPGDDLVATVMPFKSFHHLDGMAKILLGSKIIGLAGLSGGGKSIFLETLIERFAEEGLNVALYSPEWPGEQSFYRRIQRHGGPTFTRCFEHIVWKRTMRGNPFTAKEMDEYKTAERLIKAKPGKIYYYGHANSITSVTSGAANLDANLKARGSRLHVSVVDYIQRLLQGGSKEENAAASANGIVNKYKEYVDESGTIGILAAQVTKEASKYVAKNYNRDEEDEDPEERYTRVLDEYVWNMVRIDQVNLGITINPTFKGHPEHMLYVAKNSLGRTGDPSRGSKGLIPMWMDATRLEFVDHSDFERVNQIKRDYERQKILA